MNFFFTAILLTFTLLGFSQDLTSIQFIDKPETSFYLENPTTMLSEKALDRREKCNIILNSS